MRAITALLSCMLQFPGGEATAARAPRATADAVAAAIEANYFDATRGREIAGELRTMAGRGRFDPLRDPDEIASALTDALRPIDAHFHVDWSPPQPPQAASAPRARPTAGVDTGIRRVELMAGNLGLLDLAFFADFDFHDPREPARRAIDAALQLLAWSDAVIIDLRDNGGGSPAMVGYLTSAFTAPGADIYNRFRSRDGSRSEAPAQSHPSPRLEVPLYILVSARTGSAAEALAYTLKNAGRATVVGTTSAGAANPGGPVEVGEGFSVFVSDGSPVSPITGTNWEGVGVAPDIAVDAEEALRTARIHALSRILGATGDADDDLAARWTLEALQAEAAPRASIPPSLAGDYAAFRIEAVDGSLRLHQGRRPVRRLLPLSDRLYTDAVDPTRRVVFDFDPEGRAIALELHYSDGAIRRIPRINPR